MAKITNIKPQLKRPGRYSIFVDGKYSFSLSENELLKLGLAPGQEYDDSGLTDLQDKAIEDKALMRAYDMLSRRQRSVKELQDYLKKKDYDQSLIDKLINQLLEAGYLDDAKFAQAWVDDRRRMQHRSDRELRYELMKKGIDKDIITSVMTQTEESEEAALRELIDKKRRQTRYQDREKLMALLARRGFRYDQIKRALDSED